MKKQPNEINYEILRKVPTQKRREIITSLYKSPEISELVEMGLYIEQSVKEEARNRMFAGKKDPQGNLPQGQVRDLIGKLLGMDGRTYDKAKFVVQSCKSKYIDEMDSSGKVDGVYLALRQEKKKREKKKALKSKLNEIKNTSNQDIIRTAKYETMFINFLHNRIVSRPCEFLEFFVTDSIDCVITSPPYDNLREYDKGQTFTYEDFQKVARELTRILKPGGVIVWVVGDQTSNGSETGTSFKQALFFKDECGLNLHDTMIYKKSGSPHPARKMDNRYTQIFEYMFVFSKGKPKTAELICDRGNRCAGTEGFGMPKMREKDGSLIPNARKTILKLPPRTNIWRYVVGPNTSSNPMAFEHPAIFPETLVHDHLRTWTEEGDVVLDPFNGSGTTSVVAKNMKRKFTGLDISKEYCKLAAGRLEDTLDLEKLKAMSRKSNNQKEELKS